MTQEEGEKAIMRMKRLVVVGLLAGSLAACGGAQGDEAGVTAAEGAETGEVVADANNGPPPPPDMPEPISPGDEYSATTILPCGFDGAAPEMRCNAGVKRNWGEDGTTLVEVFKPDGRKRAIFFQGTTPYGADSAQADGSAGWDFEVSRKDDEVTISFGPETYVIVDALIEGG